MGMGADTQLNTDYQKFNYLYGNDKIYRQLFDAINILYGTLNSLVNEQLVSLAKQHLGDYYTLDQLFDTFGVQRNNNVDTHYQHRAIYIFDKRSGNVMFGAVLEARLQTDSAYSITLRELTPEECKDVKLDNVNIDK